MQSPCCLETCRRPTQGLLNHRPISLTSSLSKVAEGFVIGMSLKPAVLQSIDPAQYGFIPGSSTTHALISTFHRWLSATDGTGASVLTALLDFRKAFDFMDHHALIAKLYSLGVKPRSINWIIDSLRNRKQRVWELFFFLASCSRRSTPLHKTGACALPDDLIFF